MTTDKGNAGGPPLSRRRVLKLTGKGVAAAAVVVGAGAGGYELGRSGGSKPGPAKPLDRDVQRFRTRPDLKPPTLQVTDRGADPSLGYVVLTSTHRGEQEHSKTGGVLLADLAGQVVWFMPRDRVARDLKVQTYRGEPVLTWWEGGSTNGVGKGLGIILDKNYREVARIRGGNHLSADLHELTLTPDDTALITAYRRTTADLRPVGGARSAPVYDCVIQEIDVAGGKVLYEWHSLDHVPIEETKAKLEGPTFDYFHLNSIDMEPDGNLLISARNTWCLYKIDRGTGEVLWRMGGKHSDYRMGPGTAYAWQHDARRHPDGTISVFDNAADPPVQPYSRGLVLAVDDRARTVVLRHEYIHPTKLLAGSQGNVQLLPGGGAFIGWGAEPYFSEYDASGRLVLDGLLARDEHSYRAFRKPWTGRPTDRPAVVTEPVEKQTHRVYVSWNGATEVARWQALAGSGDSFAPVGSVPRYGFETRFNVRTRAPQLVVEGQDDSGKPLGRSAPVDLRG